MPNGFRIDHVDLRNFRCFERLELDLHPELTLLVGPNGRGKSALVDAIAALVGATDRRPGTHGMPLVKSDVRQGAELTQVDGRGTLEGGSTRFGVAINRAGELRATPRLPGNWAAFPLRAPFAVFGRYPADRLVEGAARTEDRSAPDPSRWWEPRTFWTDLVTWVRRETIADLQQGTPGRAVHTVRTAVDRCLAPEGIRDFHYDVRGETLMVELDGTRSPFDLASGGVRALVALVADLATRCQLANPDLEDPTESPGLVLVDEVELHLHPRWQRAFLPAVRRVFPNVQIIATTHSPQVVSSVAADSVRILDPAGIGRVASAQGLDANTLLEDIFDVSARPEVDRDRLTELFRLIDADDPDAPVRLAEAEALYGRDDPDVARARFMIEMGA